MTVAHLLQSISSPELSEWAVFLQIKAEEEQEAYEHAKRGR
jgi:hypothetical protein